MMPNYSQGPEDPPSFIVRTEVEKAAVARGYRLPRASDGPWLAYESTTAQGRIWLAAAGQDGPWFIALDHPGVAVEIGPGAPIPGPGLARYIFATKSDLYDGLDLVWRLSSSLPSAPLHEFEAETAGLPRNTEAERWVVQRVGQSIFRTALMKYWNGCCPLTGIAEPALLRASHIVGWAECDDDAHRLDAHNGLLLSALWDAAFDKGLVSFNDEGRVLFSSELSDASKKRLGPAKYLAPLTAGHLANLARHRLTNGFGT